MIKMDLIWVQLVVTSSIGFWEEDQDICVRVLTLFSVNFESKGQTVEA